MAVDVVEDDGADQGRELDGDLVEGDDDSPVGGLGDFVAGHPEDLVQGPGEQQQEQAGDSAVAVDGVVVEQHVAREIESTLTSTDAALQVGAGEFHEFFLSCTKYALAPGSQ